MPVNYKVTLEEIPKVDQSSAYNDQPKVKDITKPEGNGWLLDYSIKGNHYIYNFWKKGSVVYDYGLQTCFTGKGDDVTNNLYGEGNNLRVNTNTTKKDYIQDVEFIAGETYLFGGKASWSGTGDGDAMSVHVVASPTPVTTATSGDVNLDGDLIVPVSDSTGSHNLDGTPVVVPNQNETGWWDIKNKNVVPNYNQTGIYDLYTVEKTMSKLINHIFIDNSVNGYNELTNDNAWKVAPGHKFRIIAHNVSGNSWKVSLIMYMIRGKTINI